MVQSESNMKQNVNARKQSAVFNLNQTRQTRNLTWSEEDKQWLEKRKEKLEHFISNYKSEENGKYQNPTFRNYIHENKALETWKLRDICCLSLNVWCKENLIYTENVGSDKWRRFVSRNHKPKWKPMIEQDKFEYPKVLNDNVLAKGVNMLSLWCKEGVIPQSQNIRSR